MLPTFSVWEFLEATYSTPEDTPWVFERRATLAKHGHVGPALSIFDERNEFIYLRRKGGTWYSGTIIVVTGGTCPPPEHHKWKTPSLYSPQHVQDLQKNGTYSKPWFLGPGRWVVCLQRRHFPLNHDCLEGKVEANFSRVVMAGLVAAVVFKVGHPGFCMHQHGWSCLLSFRGIFGLFSGFLTFCLF